MKIFNLLFCLTTVVSAQINHPGSVLIKSQREDLVAIIDDSLQQPVNRWIMLNAGFHRIRVPEPGGTVWQNRDFTKEIQVTPGDTLLCEVYFPKMISLISIPFNARVIQQKDTLGTTPFILSVGSAPAEVKIEKPGYLPVVLSIPEHSTNPVQISLNEKKGTQLSNFFPKEKKSGIQPWLKISLAGVGIISGVIAVHYKQKADREYDKYIDTQDPKYYNRTNSLDHISMASFAITQVSIATFMYFLIRF